MRKKGLIAILCVLLAALPLGAVFKEDNLNHTLTVLLMELKESYANLIRISGSAEKRIQEQHEKLEEQQKQLNRQQMQISEMQAEIKELKELVQKAQDQAYRAFRLAMI